MESPPGIRKFSVFGFQFSAAGGELLLDIEAFEEEVVPEREFDLGVDLDANRIVGGFLVEALQGAEIEGVIDVGVVRVAFEAEGFDEVFAGRAFAVFVVSE